MALPLPLSLSLWLDMQMYRFIHPQKGKVDSTEFKDKACVAVGTYARGEEGDVAVGMTIEI